MACKSIKSGRNWILYFSF